MSDLEDVGGSDEDATTGGEIAIRDVNDETFETLVDAMDDAGIKPGCIRRE